MKGLLLSLLVLFFALKSANATVITVSNDAANPTSNAPYFYTTLASAYAAASNSDTLLLEGTNIPYEIGAWGKQIVVIGIGFNPNKSNPRHSQIRGTSGSNFSINSAGNGSRFYGIEFSIALAFGSSVSNYSFSDCLFQAGNAMANQTGCNNISFTNCIFTSTSNDFDMSGGTPGYANFLFTSCVFNGWIEGNSNPIGTGVLTIDHCLFLHGSLCLSSIRNTVVQNSIFMNASNPFNSNCGAMTLSNNISRLATTYPPQSSVSSNNASNNLSSTNPNFVNYTFSNNYSQLHNYNLQAGSPAIGAGTLGTNVGPHGSGSNFSETGEVLITPIIRSIVIGNTTVSPGGTLNIQINASKPTDN